MLRMAILASHPIQYQAPLYRSLAARSDIAIKVFFCWNFGVKTTQDPGFGRAIRWDIPLLDGYDHTFLPNRSKRPGTNHFLGLVNPGAPREILGWRPDVIVVHGYGHLTELWVMAAARLRRIPVLLRGESNLLRMRPLWVRSGKALAMGGVFRNVAGALAIGTLNARYCAHYGLPQSRIFLAPYTVDNAFFQSRLDEARVEARALRDALAIGHDDPVVLYAAKLIAAKDCGSLIRAFASRGRGRAALVIVGDGPLRGELTALAKSYPSAPIHFLGFVNQSRMPAAYALGSLFVLPSIHEPWGLAVNEAMNLGLPVVVSDQVGCAPDLVSPENGWVFPAGDTEALARILDSALSDADGLPRKGRASSARIARWDISHTAEGFVHGARSVANLSAPLVS